MGKSTVKPSDKPVGTSWNRVRRPALSSTACHSFGLYGVVGGLSLGFRTELSIVRLGATARADVEGAVRFIASRGPLPSTADLTTILSCEEVSALAFCKGVEFLVPGAHGVSAGDVVTVPSKADHTDEEDEGGWYAKGA
jgi:hypothetical protein